MESISTVLEHIMHIGFSPTHFISSSLSYFYSSTRLSLAVTQPRIDDPPRLLMHRTAESFSKGKVRIPLLVSLPPTQVSRTSCVLHARTVVKRGGGSGGRRLPGQ